MEGDVCAGYRHVLCRCVCVCVGMMCLTQQGFQSYQFSVHWSSWCSAPLGLWAVLVKALARG